MTKTLNVKRRSIKSPPRPRRTVHRLSIFPLSNSVPHSVTVPHGRFRHGNNRAELRTQFRTVPSFPQHLRGFQDLLRCLHSVLIGLEIEFFYKAKAIKKPHAVASATAQGFVFLYLFLCPHRRLRSAVALFSDAQRVCHFRDQRECKGIIDE